jgi:hypothetical protein
MIYIDLHQSAFVCLSENIFVSWNAMNFLELVIFKALLLFKFSRISGINDFFVARFLLLVNLISQAITQTFRYSIGSMHESREFQLMSGIKVSYTEVYWTIFPIVFIIFAGIAYLLITFKKTVEKVKEYQVQKKKNISTLVSAQSKYFGTLATSSWNTSKDNPAVFTGSQIYVFNGLLVIFCIIQLVVMDHYKSSDYESWLFTKIFIELFLFRIVGGIHLIWRRKDFIHFVKYNYF